MRQRPRLLLRAIALLGLLVLGACGGESNGCLAPGPCSGDFPDEHLPAATVRPSSVVVAVGADATFTVDAPGLTTPTYQWYRTAPGGALLQIPGATGASYTLVAAQASDDGTTFKALVDGGYGAGRLVEFSSNGVLTVR